MNTRYLRRFVHACAIAMIGVLAVVSANAAAQDDAAAIVTEQDEQTAVDPPAQPALLQTTTLPWAFGDDYVAVSALPVAGSGTSESTSLPLFTLLIGAVASAGGAIVVRARHAG